MTSAILILGGGNMGGAMARAWHSAGLAVTVVERDPVRRNDLATAGITTHAELADAKTENTILVLAIKPQQFDTMKEVIKTYASSGTLVSIMAGVTLAMLQQVHPHAIRVMPNLPALVSESMSVACAPEIDAPRRHEITQLLTHVGRCAWVEDEEMLHLVTAISGSGPGYIFAFMAALESAALAKGMAPELARTLVRQTFRGSGLLADQAVDSASELCAQVASPGGTTEAAFAMFAQGDLTGLVDKAVAAAAKRSKALAS